MIQVVFKITRKVGHLNSLKGKQVQDPQNKKGCSGEKSYLYQFLKLEARAWSSEQTAVAVESYNIIAMLALYIKLSIAVQTDC